MEQPTDDSLVITEVELLDMVGIPGEREFIYSVLMELDAPVAIEKSSINLKLTASSTAPTERRQQPNFSGSSFRAQMGVAESAIQTAASTAQSAEIVSQVSEVSSVIPNSSISSFSVPETSSIPVSMQSPVQSVAKQSAQMQSRAPVTPSPLSTTPRSLRTPRGSTPTETFVITTTSPATPSLSVLPAAATPSMSIASAAQSQISQRTSAAGLSSTAAAVARQSLRTPPSSAAIRNAQTHMVSTGRDPASISQISTISSYSPATAAVILQSSYQMPTVSEPETRYVIETEIISMKQTLVVKEDRLGAVSRFYVTACLMTSEGVQTSKSTTEVNHSKFVNEIMTPRLAPTLSASFIRQGQISIGSQQRDLQATKLRIQRRNAPSTSCRDDEGSPWETVFEEDLDINDGEIRYIDRAITSGYALMYRAIAIGSNGKSSNEFATAVVTPPISQRQIRGRELNTVVKLNSLSTAATIGVTDFPEDVISVSVRKYNLESRDKLDAKRGLTRGFSYVGDTPDGVNKLVDTKTRKTSFTDKNLAPSGRYSYVPVAFTRRGKTIIGSATEIEIPADAGDSTQVATTLTGLVVNATDAKGNTLSDATVSFNIEGALTDFGFEQISDSIGESASAGLFGGDISANREKFSDLIQFDVVRENQTTGEKESFGLYSAGGFTDSRTIRKSKQVKPLEAGVTYVYRSTACIRSAETLFPSLISSEIDSDTLQRFTKNISKFRGPMQLRNSTLASTARQSDNTKPSSIESSNPYIAGRTKDEQSLEVSIPSVAPRVSAIKSTQKRTSNSISWRVEGKKEKIDHFKVYVTRNGGRMLVGTVHGDHTSPDFKFVHESQVPQTLECTYEVVPVDLNFRELSIEKSDTISPSQSSLVSKRSLRKSTIRTSTSQDATPTSVQEDILASALTPPTENSTSGRSRTSARSSSPSRSRSPSARVRHHSTPADRFGNKK